MKNIYLIFLFISGLSFAQSELIGEWYLESFTIDGGTYTNVYSSLSNIEFTEDTNNQMGYNGSSTCNYYFGGYSATTETISFNDLGFSASDCSDQVSGKFEDLYFTLLNNDFIFPNVFNYTIEGDGNTQSLTLTKPNGDIITYSKTDPEAVLHRTWYLYSVSENGITYNISSTDTPTFILGSDVDVFFGSIHFSGTGDCNDFTGEYGIYFNNGDEIKIFNFTPTTNICNPASDFETAYFSVLGDETANTFSFELTNNGDNLILTNVPNTSGRSINTVGDVLTFSKQSLSTIDFNDLVNTISIFENPVEDQLRLRADNNILANDVIYNIYSIEGKLIESSSLKTNTINVSTIKTGVYFISFSSNDKVFKTLRFIKK